MSTSQSLDREGLYRHASAKHSSSSRAFGNHYLNSTQSHNSSNNAQLLTGVQVPKDIADEILQNFVTEDEGAKTWSRWIVEKFLSKVNDFNSITKR